MDTPSTVIHDFFIDWLPGQRSASPNTIASYRDTVKMLLGWAAAHHHTPVESLTWEHLDVTTIAAFLTDLEETRGNCPATHNQRLAGIRSLYRYAATRLPEHSAMITAVLDIPPKRTDPRLAIGYLTEQQVEALMAAPDATTWTGVRDQLLIEFMLHTGARLSEATTVVLADIHTGAAPYVRVHGNGRKERTTPLPGDLTHQLSQWAMRNNLSDHDPLFPTRAGTPMSRTAAWRAVTKHATKAELDSCSFTPYFLRYTAAIRLLQAGVDLATIALWLGCGQTDTLSYLQADMERKQQAVDIGEAIGTPVESYEPATSAF